MSPEKRLAGPMTSHRYVPTVVRGGPAVRLTTRLVFAVMIIMAVAGGTYWGGRAWWYHVELGRAERDVAAGRFASARERLVRLATAWPGRDEVEYPLGVCEAELGHIGPALDAWARVPDDSVFAPRAALDRARLALGHGRLAAAEESLRRIEGTRGEIGEAAAAAGPATRPLLGAWLPDQPPDRAPLAVVARPGRATPDALAVRHAAVPDRCGPRGPGAAGPRGPGRRPRLARPGRPRHPHRPTRRGRRLARPAARPAGPKTRTSGVPASPGHSTRGRPDAAGHALTHLPAERFLPRGSRRVRRPPGRPPGRRRGGARRAGAPGRAGARRRRGLGDAWPTWRPGTGRGGRPPGAGASTQGGDRPGERRIPHADGRRSPPGTSTHERPSWPGAAEALAAGSRPGAGGPSGSGQAPTTARPARRSTASPVPNRATAAGARPGRTLAELVADLAPEAPSSGGRARCRVRPGIGRRRRSRSSATTPRPPGCGSSTTTARPPLRQLPETMGGGVGLLDYDGDGWLDVYCVQGGPFPPAPGAPPRTATASSATGATAPSRTSPSRPGSPRSPGGYGHGVAVGDYDNDGHPDLFVTRWRSYALYRNRGDGTFEDATEAAGPGRRPRLADLGGLRRPRRRRRPRPLRLPLPGLGRRATRGSAATPTTRRLHRTATRATSAALPDHLFRNDGGRFVDVTAEAGHRRPRRPRPGRRRRRPRRRRPGRPVRRQRHDGQLPLPQPRRASGSRRSAHAAGRGGQRRGGLPGGHGGRLRRPRRRRPARPGRDQLLRRVDHLLPQPRRGPLRRPDRRGRPGRRRAGTCSGFGIAFLDANNDGRLDLATANGHVNDFRPTIPYAMPAQLLLGGARRPAGRRLRARPAPPWRVPRVGRGLAVGDLDNDGRVDVLIARPGRAAGLSSTTGPPAATS